MDAFHRARSYFTRCVVGECLRANEIGLSVDAESLQQPTDVLVSVSERRQRGDVLPRVGEGLFVNELHFERLFLNFFCLESSPEVVEANLENDVTYSFRI